jgi:hypothetical protein
MKRLWVFSTVLLLILTLSTACQTNRPGQTPTPTVTSEENLIKDPTGTLVILSHSAYAGHLDKYHIVGEILNTSDMNMRFIQVAATLYDEKGEISGVSSMYTFADILPAKAKTPFNIEFYDQDPPASYKLQLEGFETDSQQLKNLEILSQSLIKNNSAGYDLLGEIKNNRSISANHVRIIVTLYNQQNKVVGAEYGFAELTELPSGGTSPFRIWIYDDIPFDHYELILAD